MGLFSWTCAKTNLPIMASTSWPSEFCRVVVLTPEGDVFRGTYDGYGRVHLNGGGAVEVLMEGAKFVAERFYKGESFAQLGKSGNEPGQGHFHDAALVKRWYKEGGFKSYRDYVNAYNA